MNKDGLWRTRGKEKFLQTANPEFIGDDLQQGYMYEGRKGILMNSSFIFLFLLSKSCAYQEGHGRHDLNWRQQGPIFLVFFVSGNYISLLFL